MGIGRKVVVEVRTGSGVIVSVVPREGAFHHHHGAVTQQCVGCNPAMRREMDRFYDRIDDALAAWEFRRDLELGCPYAVKRAKRERRHLAALRRLKAGLAAKGGRA